MASHTVMFFSPRESSAVPVIDPDTIVSEVIAGSGTSAASVAAADYGSTMARVFAGADIWLAFGAAPVATAGGAGMAFIQSGSFEDFLVPKGNKVAVLEA